MNNVIMRFDLSLFLDLVKYVFVPVLIIVVIVGIAIFIYSGSIKEEDINRYNYVTNFWSCLLANVIIGALLAITIGFSVSITNSMVVYHLVDDNRTFYYIVMALPLLPLIFLILYFVKFVKVVLTKNKSLDEDYITYKVKKGDTLEYIADKYYTTEDRIEDFNNLASNVLTVGQIVKVPIVTDDEKERFIREQEEEKRREKEAMMEKESFEEKMEEKFEEKKEKPKEKEKEKEKEDMNDRVVLPPPNLVEKEEVENNGIEELF